MSPHLPDDMENPSGCSNTSPRVIPTENKSSCAMSAPSASSSISTSTTGILFDEERPNSNASSSLLPLLAGLPLRIRSASLPALIELCVMCFGDEGDVLEAATNYPNIFFLMHKWFTTSELLAQDLRRLFEMGKPSYHLDYSTLLASVQQNSSPSASNGDPSSRPPSVILSRKQVDDCNGNVGLRSPSLLRTPNSNGRSNPVLIPRPACIGVEDDNYFNYHYSKLSAMAEAGAGSIEVVDSKTAMAATTQMEKPASDKSPEADSCGKPSSSTRDEHSCPTGDQCKHDRGAVCQVYKFRRSICYAVHFWIRQFPVHFDLDARLCVLIKEWQRQLLTNPCTATESRTWYYPELAPLMDLTCLPSYDWIRNISVRDPTVKHCRKVSLVFNHLEPCDLAKHLTYLEHRIMRRISFQDYKQYAVTGSLNDNPRLERSVNLFNGLTQWVQCMVLSRSTPQQRAEVIVKLIEVTKQLKDLRNFNSLMAVVGGLSHSSLARLSRTASRVPADSQRTLAELTEFLSSSSNFSNYRRALQDCKGFKIPILGIHMKDLISLHVALSDAVEGGLINFRKMAQLSLIFQELQELQNATPPAGANVDLVNTLRVSLELAYTEDEIYELSLAREPRDSLSPQSSPTRPSLLNDWPTSSQSIHMQTLTPNSAVNNHQTSSCEGSRSGSRSASLTSPLMSLLPPSTGLIMSPHHSPRINAIGTEQDQDLSLSSTTSNDTPSKKSREERMIETVFSDPKNQSLKYAHRSSPTEDSINEKLSAEPAIDVVFDVGVNSPVYKHDFQETSSFRPCTCAHCNGLLWGPLRQAYKCRECGLAAHKVCKDILNLRCQPKSLVSTPFLADGFQGGTGKTRFRRRKKLSSQSDVDSLESGLLAMDCCCELSCQSPCSRRSSIGVPRHRDSAEFHSQGRLSAKGLLVEMSGGSSESSTPLLSRSQMFQSPKRRSLVGTTGGTSAAVGSLSALISSPMPIIRHRKASLSSALPCRSFPGSEASHESSSSSGHRSSLSTSPRRKISDTLHLLGSSPTRTSSSCPCSHNHGH